MSFIVYIQAILAVLIIFSILLQHRSSGLSATMGGAGVTYVQRRGAEKFLYQGTVILSIIFFVLTILDWFI
jgi:protein translocase SecG subunit